MRLLSLRSTRPAHQKHHYSTANSQFQGLIRFPASRKPPAGPVRNAERGRKRPPHPRSLALPCLIGRTMPAYRPVLPLRHTTLNPLHHTEVTSIRPHQLSHHRPCLTPAIRPCPATSGPLIGRQTQAYAVAPHRIRWKQAGNRRFDHDMQPIRCMKGDSRMDNRG